MLAPRHHGRRGIVEHPRCRVRIIRVVRLLDLVPIVGPPPRGRGKGRRVGRAQYWHDLSRAWRTRYGESIHPWALRMRWQRFANAYPKLANLVYSLGRTED
jgi:hypothetical protein